MHSWQHVHLMKLCMCWAGCRVFVYIWCYQTFRTLCCLCVTVCSPQKCMLRIFALVCGSKGLCVLVCAFVQLCFWIYMLWNAGWLTGPVMQLFGNFEKNKNISFVRSYLRHIHTMKWNKHFNFIFKSDFQPSLTVSIKHVWSLMFDTNTFKQLLSFDFEADGIFEPSRDKLPSSTEYTHTHT